MVVQQIDPASVREVMSACNVAEDRAANVLRRCRGNVEQAKSHLKKLQQTLKGPTPPQMPSTPSSGSISLPRVGQAPSGAGTFTPPPTGGTTQRGFPSPPPYQSPTFPGGFAPPTSLPPSVGSPVPWEWQGMQPGVPQPPQPPPQQHQQQTPRQHQQLPPQQHQQQPPLPSPLSRHPGQAPGYGPYASGMFLPGVADRSASAASGGSVESRDPMDWTRGHPAGSGVGPGPQGHMAYPITQAPIPIHPAGPPVSLPVTSPAEPSGWHGSPGLHRPSSSSAAPPSQFQPGFQGPTSFNGQAQGQSSQAPPYYSPSSQENSPEHSHPGSPPQSLQPGLPPAPLSTQPSQTHDSHPPRPTPRNFSAPVSLPSTMPLEFPSGMPATGGDYRSAVKADSSSSSRPGIAPIQQNGLQRTQTIPRKLIPDQHRDHHSSATRFPLHPPEPTQPAIWDYTLPGLQSNGMLAPAVNEDQSVAPLDIHHLVGAITHGATPQAVRAFLDAYDENTLGSILSEEVEGFPAIFYVVAANNPAILRMWVAHGTDVSATHEPTGTPLLAFAIMNAENTGSDTTNIVATLLSLGASPASIPKEFYTPYAKDLPPSGPERKKHTSEDADKVSEEEARNELAWKWCTETATKKLARNMHLTHRYNLERAVTAKKLSKRHRWVASRRKADAILGVPYFLVGQSLAANRLLTKILSYLVIPTSRPLVLAFTGPSGHGKTELARCLGVLLDLELEVVDCTIFNREMELFGPRHPYTGADRGAPLNNFLVRNAGQRCIVFLDEFEKTTSSIHQALLLPFDKGEYQDRRTLNNIDCSKTIWILATNALDATIQGFCEKNEQILTDSLAAKEKLGKELTKELKSAFLAEFDAPLTGRVSDFIPFLPFSSGEQAVVVHKFILELVEKVKLPIRLAPGKEEQILGNVRLHIARDGTICKTLADGEYSKDLGARSLATAVRVVEDLLVDCYLDEDAEIIETSEVRDFVVDVKDGGITVSRVRVLGPA